MHEPSTPVDLKTLRLTARLLLESLLNRFASRVGELEGERFVLIPGLDYAFRVWAERLARAPAKLLELYIDRGGIWDLSPLSGLTALEDVQVTHTRIDSVETLASLPELRQVDVSESDLLTSIRPLASCPKLEKVDAHDCPRLEGPRTIQELRSSCSLASR